jgi:hypothetical protein
MIKIKEEIFQYYFYFIQERMNIFWNRYEGREKPWTQDPIFKTYKFTNVYRACDRVSQYLIKNVVYNNDYNFSDRDILFRIILFKIFNKIETWEYLEKKLGVIKLDNFIINDTNRLLSERRNQFPIFNNAYMMTGTHSLYNHLNYKHEKWLQMVNDELIKAKIFEKVLSAKSMEQVYYLLRNCSFIGDFLAYQYTIDFNYSPVINFSEDSFVKAGIGAIRGIKKCFTSLDGKSYEDVIRYTHENFDKFQEKFRYNDFKNLFGRNLTLIDIQNCFCETDKYLRAKVPELQVDNVRIKQKYKESPKLIDLFFPPKWGLNSKITNQCLPQNTKELIHF